MVGRCHRASTLDDTLSSTLCFSLMDAKDERNYDGRSFGASRCTRVRFPASPPPPFYRVQERRKALQEAKKSRCKIPFYGRRREARQRPCVGRAVAAPNRPSST